MTSKADVEKHAQTGSWRTLMRLAADIVKDAENKAAGSPMRPLLGGGTRLMLSLHHRISDDIGLFIRDPQWIGYLTPRLNDRTESLVDSYEENAVSLKLRRPEGEIDFIVSMSLLDLPTESLPDILFGLEPVAEVLAKKLFYRGALLSPRDLLDWWAIGRQMPLSSIQRSLARLLKDRLDGIEKTLQVLRTSPGAQLIWLELRAPDKPPIAEAVDFALAETANYREILSRP
jgi:hypothetical protein